MKKTTPLLTALAGIFALTIRVNGQMAFFYQKVGPFVAGTGLNTVEIGSTNDGINISTHNISSIHWYVGPSSDSTYGDPVVSYLPDGKWTFTAWTGPSDPRGAGKILYYESPCPIIVDSEVINLGSSSASGCQVLSALQIGKTSQVFEEGGKTYLFHSTSSKAVHLACLSDSVNSAMNLTSLCAKSTAYSTLAELNYGETMPVYSSDSLLLSDVAIARRLDGTWVLFMKGISDTSTCTQGSLCELSARGIYRTTSSDLINWSTLEKVVSQASVPEASVDADGKVWLYWQDFTNAISANNLMLASIAPISGSYETPGTYEFSSPVQANFLNEAFQTNSSLHYATNANPVYLPDSTAVNSLQSCLIANGGTGLGLKNNYAENNFVKIFPNPFKNSTNLEISSLVFSNCNLFVYDVFGQEVYKQQINSTLETLSLNLNQGIYFYKITQCNLAIFGNGKIVVR